MEIRNILRKKPFYRIAPPMFDNIEMVSDINTSAANTQKVQYIIRTQADFLREYDVSGHKINSRFIYPDKVSKDEKGNIVIHHIARMALPLQKMITKKHLVYCCGNDIEFRLLSPNPTEEDEILRSKFKEGWISKNMEIAFYAAIKADKVTGDCAFCGVLQGGKFSWRVFSYLDGDTLYPQYDRITGGLNVFGRKYSQFDESGEEVIEYLDVWDNENIYIISSEIILLHQNELPTKLNNCSDLTDGYKMERQNSMVFHISRLHIIGLGILVGTHLRIISKHTSSAYRNLLKITKHTL